MKISSLLCKHKKNIQKECRVFNKKKSNNGHFNQVMPYSIKRVYIMMLLALGLTPMLPSCTEKDDTEPDTITALRADSTRLAGEVRAAVLPAKTVDYNITNYFEGMLHSIIIEDGGVYPQNLPDSSDKFIKVVNAIKADGVTLNGQTLDSLKSKSSSYLSTIEAINELLSKTSR